MSAKTMMFPVVVASAVVLLASCATTHQRTYDKKIPKEQTAVMCFGDGIYVTSYNGIDVAKAWYGGSYWSDERVKVTLPAGEAAFDFHLLYYNQITNATYNAKDLKMRYDLEAGKKYSMFFVYNWSKKSWGIAMYDNIPIPILRFRTGKIIAFWPMDF